MSRPQAGELEDIDRQIMRAAGGRVHVYRFSSQIGEIFRNRPVKTGFDHQVKWFDVKRGNLANMRIRRRFNAALNERHLDRSPLDLFQSLFGTSGLLKLETQPLLPCLGLEPPRKL